MKHIKDNITICKLLLLFLVTLSYSKTNKVFIPVAAGQDLNEIYDKLRVKVLNPLEQTYNELSPRGKFATGAFVGFTSSRMFVRTATKMIKIAGISYIGSEVLSKAGFLDDIDDYVSYENQEMIQQMASKLKHNINFYRVQMKEKLNPKKIKGYIDTAMSKDKMSSTGFATGATFGLLV